MRDKQNRCKQIMSPKGDISIRIQNIGNQLLCGVVFMCLFSSHFWIVVCLKS